MNKKNFMYLLAGITTATMLSAVFSSCSSDGDEGYSGVSQYAKEVGLKEVAINQDANSSEICYFIKENGDTITLVGDKDENGCAENIYLMKYNTNSNKLFTRFDEQMRPISLTYNDKIDISLEWINEKSAIIKTLDPETNTYISTIWNSEETSQTMAAELRTISKSNQARKGETKLTIEEIHTPKYAQNRAGEAVEDISNQYCIFSVTQCDYPKDASTWIGLSNAKTHKFIENLEYYKKSSTGVYLYRIPADSYPSKATNQELCTRIDNWVLSPLQVGLTWLAEFSSVADVIALACASTGIGVPPAAILEALSVATIVGAGTLTVFMYANGTQGLMSTFNPDWYYKEYVIADVILTPCVITSTDVIVCEQQVITPETTNIRVNCDIDGEPTIDSFILEPNFPASGQSYVASATFHCVPIGSTITMSIVGTDGYTDSQTTTTSTTSGTANLHVPGATTGVKDVCKVVLTPPTGETITMTASLVFGF